MKLTVHTERGTFRSKTRTVPDDKTLLSLNELVEMAAGDKLIFLTFDTENGSAFISGELLKTAVFVIEE